MSNKATAKERAQKKQNRKDHFTNADRQLFKDFKGVHNVSTYYHLKHP